MTGMEAAVESALRTLMADLDYDLHKALECDEETGHDWYPGHAAVFAEALALAGFGNLHDAWAEGHRTPVQRERSDCRCGAWCENECACGKYGTGKIVTPNPYPKVSET